MPDAEIQAAVTMIAPCKVAQQRAAAQCGTTPTLGRTVSHRMPLSSQVRDIPLDAVKAPPRCRTQSTPSAASGQAAVTAPSDAENAGCPRNWPSLDPPPLLHGLHPYAINDSPQVVPISVVLWLGFLVDAREFMILTETAMTNADALPNTCWITPVRSHRFAWLSIAVYEWPHRYRGLDRRLGLLAEGPGALTRSGIGQHLAFTIARW